MAFVPDDDTERGASNGRHGFGPSAGQLLQDCFKHAAERGFPAFLGPVSGSTPLNATPYVTSLSDVRSGAALPHRSDLMQGLVAAVDEMRAHGIEPLAVLIGGSVLDAKAAARDLDCVIFYSRTADLELPAKWLKAAQCRWRDCRLDARLIPADASPLLLIKTVSFFTALYSQNKTSGPHARGLVLIDCCT
jgi:hypothetical protein